MAAPPTMSPVAKCHDTHGWRRSAPLSRTAVMELGAMDRREGWLSGAENGV